MGDDFRAVHPYVSGPSDAVLAGWRAFSRSRVPLELMAGNGRTRRSLVAYLRSLPRLSGDVVTVVVPEQLEHPSLLRLLRRGTTLPLKLRLLGEPGVVVTNVPVLAPSGTAPDRPPYLPRRTVALVLVPSVNDALVRAIAYARTLRVADVRAVYFALDHEQVDRVWEAWLERKIPVELTIVDAPFRELGPPILDEVRRVTCDGAIASVIVPELVVREWRHELLHNQRALFIKPGCCCSNRT